MAPTVSQDALSKVCCSATRVVQPDDRHLTADVRSGRRVRRDRRRWARRRLQHAQRSDADPRAGKPRGGCRLIPRTIPHRSAGGARPSRRASWLPVCVGQRPPTAMARQRGPFDVSLADPGVGGQQHQQHLVRHRGDLSHIPLPSGHRRSGVCLAGDPEPRTGVSGAGHRRAAQRTSRHRHVRQLPRAPRPADRGHRTDPPAVER
ncbi:F420-dependent glucose-6-phosphate dehydrogenase [Mycobacterium tuberculosis]|nr:F420-dependent glucose-6-phosphate dehydrogenase [Mycobacterium tuberculosis]CKP72037.1 Uncharacterised protein [Mycobacterium tuberculosis]SGO26175.1 Uncharacterised protein [Mycobacterium tuberculosis]